MEVICKNELSYHEDTELTLGQPGRTSTKRSFSNLFNSDESEKICHDQDLAPSTKMQAIGWPPVKSYRKNCLQAATKPHEDAKSVYVKVSMDGAPFLRKVDLQLYKGYKELLKALEGMFKLNFDMLSNKVSEYEPTYEDKDGDWMLVGDVPWEMFITSCKRLRIMKGSETKGLDCLA